MIMCANDDGQPKSYLLENVLTLIKIKWGAASMRLCGMTSARSVGERKYCGQKDSLPVLK